MVYGQENSNGDQQSTLGALLILIGLSSLVLAIARSIYRRFRARFERIRDWWTGSG